MIGKHIHSHTSKQRATHVQTATHPYRSLSCVPSLTFFSFLICCCDGCPEIFLILLNSKKTEEKKTRKATVGLLFQPLRLKWRMHQRACVLWLLKVRLCMCVSGNGASFFCLTLVSVCTRGGACAWLSDKREYRCQSRPVSPRVHISNTLRVKHAQWHCGEYSLSSFPQLQNSSLATSGHVCS